MLTGRVEHDAIRIVILRAIQCIFKDQSKNSQQYHNDVAKTCRFQIRWGLKLKRSFWELFYKPGDQLQTPMHLESQLYVSQMCKRIEI